MTYPDNLSYFSGWARDLLECGLWWRRNYPELYWAVMSDCAEYSDLLSGAARECDKDLYEYYRKELNK